MTNRTLQLFRRTLWILTLAFAAAHAEAASPAEADFSGPAEVMALQPHLQPWKPGAGMSAPDWYVFQAANPSALPVSRILQAGALPGRSLSFFPKRGRPALRPPVSASPNLIIEKMPAYGADAYRLRLPPHSAAEVAVKVRAVAGPPALLAWSPPALAAFRQRSAIYNVTITVLIAAAALISGGLMVLLSGVFLRRVSAFLLALTAMRLASSGLLDGGLVTPLGGPYGLEALCAALALGCGWQLAQQLVPFPFGPRWGRICFVTLLAGAVLAWLGLPGCVSLVNGLTILLTGLITLHILRAWARGEVAAGTLAPAAVLFTLGALTAMLTSFGLFGSAALRPDISGGFYAAGAVLCILAAGLTWRAGDVSQADAAAELIRQAQWGAHQGVWRCDFRADRVSLSAEAAALIGRGAQPCEMKLSAWLALLHAEDRARFAAGIEEDRNTPGLRFRKTFRGTEAGDATRHFTLCGTMQGDFAPADACVAVLTDDTEAALEAHARQNANMQDALTGLGNRVGLMARLDGLGGALPASLCLVADIDGFRGLRRTFGDELCDALLIRMAERLHHRLPRAEIFRIGGDAFAALLPAGTEEVRALGADLCRICAVPYVLAGEGLLAPVSIGLAEGRSAADPLELICHAERALRQAQSQGNGIRIYAAGMDTLALADSDGLENALARALAGGALAVAYLPLMRTGDHTVAGFRTRLRWLGRREGMPTPEDVVAHSENAELVRALQRFILAQTVARLKEWQQYFPLSEPLFATVPVLGPGRQEDDPDLRPGALPVSALSPGSLHLAFLRHHLTAPGAEKYLAGLKGAGAGLVLADYAGRTAERAALTRLPFDLVTVTGRGPLCGAEGSHVLTDALHARRDGHVRVLAEGVESAEDALRAGELGAELAAGGYFAAPMDAGEALKFIAGHFRAADSRMAV